jgi:hypothetical protein
MSDYQQIVNSEYNKLTDKLFKKIGTSTYKINKHNNKSILNLVSDDSIINAKYQFFGSAKEVGDKEYIFNWSYNSQLSSSEMHLEAKKIKESKNDIEQKIIKKKYNDIEYMEKILYYVSSPMFFIYEKNIDDLIKFGVYYTKSPGIVSEIINNGTRNEIKYYLLTDIVRN